MIATMTELVMMMIEMMIIFIGLDTLPPIEPRLLKGPAESIRVSNSDAG